MIICFEHSFWISHQGSNFIDGFKIAREIYFETRHALVVHELHDYLKSKNSRDWFIRKHIPSEEECAECRKIIFNNLLHMPILCLLWVRIADIFLAHRPIFT